MFGDLSQLPVSNISISGRNDTVSSYDPLVQPEKSCQVLLVDDESVILDITSRFLERTGKIETICCNSADEALIIIQARAIDVIVSDYDMPDMDGIDLLSWIRKSGYSTPFILYTGRGREEVVIEALNNGATHYLRKGGEPKSLYAELVNIICQVSDKIRSEQEVREKEHLITTIFEHLPDPTYAIDLHGRVIAWNRAMEEFTGILRVHAEGVSDYKHCLPFYVTSHRVPADTFLGKSEVCSRRIHSAPANRRDNLE